MATNGIKRAATEMMALLERAVEMRLSMHVLCVALYLEIGLFFITGKTLLTLTWNDIEQMMPGPTAILIVGYFLLMGYVLRLLYAVLLWATFPLHDRFREERETRGLVHEHDVLKKAYESKDYELTRMMEAHKEECRQDRKETGELAYVLFAALVFGIFDYLLVHAGILSQGRDLVVGLVGDTFASVVSLFLVAPLGMLMWATMANDYSRDMYIAHVPLYREIQEEKRKEREGYGMGM